MADFRQLIRASEREYPNLNYLKEDSETSRELAGVFGVSENEIPLVCTAQKANDLALSIGKNVLITDTSVLIKDGEGPVMRMPLSRLYSVLISYKSRKKKVLFITPSGRIELYTPKMVFKDNISFELYSLLVTLQNALINENPSLKESYYHTLDALSSYVKSCFKNQAYLSDENRELLIEILHTDPNNLIAGMVLKEDRYRTFDATVPPAQEEKFYSNYLTLIATDYSSRLYRTMIKAYSRLLSKDTLSLKDAYLLCALGYRMNDQKTYLLYDRIQKYLTENQKHFLNYISARVSREGMDSCMSMILTGKIPSGLQLQFTDDMGFDCLHYAIILEKKEIVSELLKQKTWGAGEPSRSAGLANSFYDYFFLASWHINDVMFLREVFIYTRPEASEVCRTLKRGRSLRGIAVSRLSLINNKIATIKKRQIEALNSGNPMAYSDYELAISSLLEEKNDLKLELAYLKKCEEQTEDELDVLFNKALSQAKEMLAVLKTTAHPMVSYMLQTLKSPESFITLHAMTPDSYTLLRYRGLCFLGKAFKDLKGILSSEIIESEEADRKRFFTAKTSPINNPWREHEREQEKKREKDRKKSYENYQDNADGAGDNSTGNRPERGSRKTHWFSEAAIHDDRILKKEYHLLIKRYHPDQTGNSDGLETLKEIIEEKDMILRQAP
ncbi:MAG: hypothetical protein DUD27_06200 [Lachnospiraceae bacterium]|uniref:J domain-containing protein n=1 Tax=Candidatus Weimeria bifida TaxID=2599074 RepID=A0A6N7IWC2_9FIRM|nr:hypothetical protein [Candidatus Weimeria bifida]RRF96118.1 MAG: hypothetical protein DUD27_06200 [Lachnospiraceae bacterium]